MVQALFDTGCDRSMVSQSFVQDLPEHFKRAYQPDKTHRMRTISGEVVTLDGLIRLTVYMGTNKFRPHVFLVGGDTDLIIGHDFMQKHAVYFVPHEGVVKYGGQAFKAMVGKAIPPTLTKCYRATVLKSVEIKRDAEKMVRVRIVPPADAEEWDASYGMLTGVPSTTTMRGLVLPRILTGKPLEYDVPVLNVSTRKRRFRQGETIAQWEPVNVMEGQSVVDESAKELPEHLQKLIDESDLETDEQREALSRTLSKFRKAFAGPGESLGRTHLVQHRIDTGDARPIKQQWRRTNPTADGVIKEQIISMGGEDVIEGSDSPWASPVVLVKKKSGEMRFCVDYRRLNAVTRKDSYPIPRIDESLEALGGSYWFITLDLKSGYWQVPMHPDDKEKTAFITKHGLFQFKVLPFGLTCAPATFERLMDKLLRGLTWRTCLVYIDDVMVFGKTFKETLENFEEVLGRLQGADLKLKPSKCSLFRREVEFLGHRVSGEGIKTDPSKCDRVANWPQPKQLEDVRSFLGLAGYYRRFVPNYSHIASPLTGLTKKNVKFHWDEEQAHAFAALKRALTSSPILGFPRDGTFEGEEGRYILDTDASGTGLGAVLSQIQEGEERVIAYGSHTMSTSQRNYCTTRRELLAVVVFVQQYCHYLGGSRRFTLRTDHASLTWLRNMKGKTDVGLLNRWLLILDEYVFDTIHRPGVNHGNADALSRTLTKRCPSTYVGCPACYGNESEVVSPDEEYMHCHARKAELAEGPLALNKLPQMAVVRTHSKAKAQGLVATPTTPYLVKGRSEKSEVVESSDTDDWETPQAADSLVLSSSSGDDTVKEADDGLSTEGQGSGSPSGDSDDLNLLVTSWTPRRVVKEQKSDPIIAYFRDLKLAGGAKPRWGDLLSHSTPYIALWQKWDELRINRQGVLLRVVRPNATSGLLTRRVQMVVPTGLVRPLLVLLHDHKLAGHGGVVRTAELVKQRYYWPNYRREIKHWVKQCVPCQIRRKSKTHTAPMRTVPAEHSGFRVAIDVLSITPKSTEGYDCVLVLTDQTSKWVEAWPMIGHKTEQIAKILCTEYFCRYGPPTFLHSDQGKEFNSKLMFELCRLMECKKTRTTPYHPQSDGQTERYNRTLCEYLRAYVSKSQGEWAKYLPYALFSYRVTPHSSTGVAPCQLWNVAPMRWPTGVLYSDVVKRPVCTQEYAKCVEQAVQMVTHIALKRLKKAALRQKYYYDRRASRWVPKRGMWVWRVFPSRVGTKLSPRKEGPFLVLSLVSPLNVLIQRGPGKTQFLVHINDLEEAFGFENERLFKKWIKPRKKDRLPELLANAPDPILLLSVSENSADTDSEACIQVVGAPIPKSSEGEKECRSQETSGSVETSASLESSGDKDTGGRAETRHRLQEELLKARTADEAEVCKAVERQGPVTRSRTRVYTRRSVRTAQSRYARYLTR
jgi:transposase InsO family protein